MFKSVREWWMYWRYRNVTRRWQMLKPRLRLWRPRPNFSSQARARGTAMYMPTRSSGNVRGLMFVVVAAAVLAVVNAVLGASWWLDVILFAAMAVAYVQFTGV